MDPRPVDAGSLFQAHAGFVTGFLLQMGVRREDVEDLVQAVFLVAHRRGGYVEGPARPTTWLAEIALRIASRHRRGRARRPTVSDDDAVARVEASSPQPDRAAETAQSLQRVQRALDGLDLDRRAIFVLFELEGESCVAIAAALGLPLNTVYSRLNAARRDFTARHERLSRLESPGATSAQPGAGP